jgi:hypothetical protein
MKLPDALLNPNPKSLRQFAVGWLVFFFGMAGYQFGAHDRTTLALWLGGVAIAGYGLYRLRPSLFRWVFVGWMRLAFPVGWLSSQVALAIMFYGVITPTALLFRMLRRDRLGLRKPRGASSYWAPRNRSTDVRRYFRPY